MRELNIISNHGNFNGKEFQKYSINGSDYIGVWGDEPFSINFKNKSNVAVQAKISIDGTDIITGKLASLSTEGKMWSIKPYSDVFLSAWTESMSGGSRFVFSSASNGVGLNTHGNISDRGVIAIAIYEESYRPPNIRRIISKSASSGWGTLGVRLADAKSLDAKTLDCCDEPAVGAGEYIDQKISYTTAFVKPILTEIIRVKYVWYDDLKEMIKRQESLRANRVEGFPADTSFINLTSVPKVKGMTGCFSRATMNSDEVSRFTY